MQLCITNFLRFTIYDFRDQNCCKSGVMVVVLVRIAVDHTIDTKCEYHHLWK